jgi:hypothetical protein
MRLEFDCVNGSILATGADLQATAFQAPSKRLSLDHFADFEAG